MKTNQQTIVSKIFQIAVLIMGWLLLLASFLLVIGSLFPLIPYLGIASIFMPNLPIFIWIMAILGFGLIHWKTNKTKIQRVVTSLALFTILATFFITIQMAHVFKVQKVDISIFKNADLTAKSGKPDSVIEFGTYDGIKLYGDVFKPAKHKGLAPIFINIHGGAWVGNTRDETALDQKWFADQGYLTFSIDYTLSNDKKHYWNSVHSQIGCFLNWLNAHASEFGGDTSKIILAGGSAGGNLALNVASMSGQNTLQSTCGGILPGVRAVIGIVPGINPSDIMKNHYSLIGPALYKSVQKYPGGLPDQYPDRYKAINCNTYLSSKNPPILIFSAHDDHLVFHKSIDDYVLNAQKMGIPTVHVQIPYGDHGAFGVPGSIGNEGFRKVALNWLSKLGLAPMK